MIRDYTQITDTVKRYKWIDLIVSIRETEDGGEMKVTFFREALYSL